MKTVLRVFCAIAIAVILAGALWWDWWWVKLICGWR